MSILLSNNISDLKRKTLVLTFQSHMMRPFSFFPFDHNSLSSRHAFDLISKKLQELGPRVLLFLSRIDEIEWSVDPDEEKGQYLKETKPIETVGKARYVTVIGQKNGQDEGENWLVFERSVSDPDGRNLEIRVEVGFRLEISTEDNTENIVRENNTSLVVYFPTEKHTRLGFLIQGPYRTTTARDNILGDDDWNKQLINETAELAVESFRQLKKMGLLSVSLLEALPIRTDDFLENSMFYPIFNRVREALMNEKLLPADDDTFVAARNAKLARGAALMEILNLDQLRALFSSNDETKWLSDNITRDRTPDLHSYLTQELGVDELTPDSFARQVTESFLASQTDEWFVDFYRYLSDDQEALWRAPRWEGDTRRGPLRLKAILRLQDGSQVVPFQSDDTTPNAFLPPPEETNLSIVKRSIVSDDQSRNFLKQLGLSEPDVFDDIVERVLPKYKGVNAAAISQDEHAADIQKIHRAMASDSEKGKEKVMQAARQTPFLKAVDLSGMEAFKKPIEVYKDSPDLRLYFSECSDVWFLDEQQATTSTESDIWRELGVECLPRRIPFSDGFPDEERENSTRGETIENYNLHGLGSFLESLQHDRDFEDKKEAALVLWGFLNKHLVSNHRFFQGRYQWFYYNERSKSFDSQMLTYLQSAQWIPTRQGIVEKPGDLTTDQLPDELIGANELIEALGINQSAEKMRREYAGKLGVTLDDVELIKAHRDDFERFKAEIAARKECQTFPTRRVKDPRRRGEGLEKELADAPGKEYEEVEISDRITRNTIDPHPQLREQYRNDADQLICQICKEEMPFKKRDDKYYFEAVEALSREYFPKEHGAQFLALCPLCAAMYKEFIKRDEAAMKNQHHALKNSDGLEVPLELGELQTSIRFVETHHHDIKTILNAR